MLCKVTDELIEIYSPKNILKTAVVIERLKTKRKHVFWRLRDAGEYLGISEELMEDAFENKIPFLDIESGKFRLERLSFSRRRFDDCW